jgi:AcrR family transcriptional regulator
VSRVTRLGWIRAGQQLLREGGIGSVKVRDLARTLGVTTGSFYHHFDSFDAYLTGLTTQFADDSEQLQQRLADLPPTERIRALLTIRTRADVPALDRAMRVWAATDERARAALARLDGVLLTLIETAFLDLDLDPAEARMRARTAYAAGIGLGMMAAPWPIGDDEEDRAVALFLGPPYR